MKQTQFTLPNTSKFYTGIGARKTPQNILIIMTDIAIKMQSCGYTLRSGGAEGADTAFERGTMSKEIYYASDATEFSMEIASRYHPFWHKMGNYAKKLHGRNTFQVLGRELDTPSGLIFCWTPDGCISHSERSRETGGTGTAISIADANNVPVYNLKRKDHLEKIKSWLG